MNKQPESDHPVLISKFKSCQVANISDNMDRLAGAPGIRPFHSKGTMAGRALTVQAAEGDNLEIHKALDLIKPGDVVVVDGGGYEGRALVGEIMTTIAKTRRAAGIVIDGAIRDADAIGADTFPVFARAACHIGPYKNGPGKINVPVSVGGMIVNPGDIIVGDADGIVAFSPDIAHDLLEATKAQEKKEEEILASIADGSYVGAYAK